MKYGIIWRHGWRRQHWDGSYGLIALTLTCSFVQKLCSRDAWTRWYLWFLLESIFDDRRLTFKTLNKSMAMRLPLIFSDKKWRISEKWKVQYLKKYWYPRQDQSTWCNSQGCVKFVSTHQDCIYHMWLKMIQT